VHVLGAKGEHAVAPHVALQPAALKCRCARATTRSLDTLE
jgi:hypothetical protein